jgi:predicted phage terminase large subunit-like protein
MAPGGTLFRVGRIAVRDVPPQDINWVRAWDLAATEATGRGDPDWTVGLKLGRDSEGRFVVGDIVRLRAGPYEVTEAIAATAARDGKAVPIGLPQDPGQAGRHQVAWLTGRLAGYIVHASPESGAKAVRAMPVAAQIEAGNLTLLSGAWNAAFLAELEEFPLGRKDDQVDALSRAFAMLLSTTPTTRRMNVPLFAR